MARLGSRVLRSLTSGGIVRSLSSLAAAGEEKIVASVVVERLPVVIPSAHSSVDAFKTFSFQWRQQYRRHYPQELLDASSNRGEEDERGVYEAVPSVTEADLSNDRRSLHREYTKRLYLLVRGVPSGGKHGEGAWHFPEKEYAKEPSLRQCAELALGSVFEDIQKMVYFVGNAPCGFLPFQSPSLKRFFFKSQLLVNEFPMNYFEKYSDFAWVSKDELTEYFPDTEAAYLNKMLQ